MALYFIRDNAAVAWGGEPIATVLSLTGGGTETDDVQYPLNIEGLWTDDELAAIGLYRPLPADAVPTGKIVLSTSAQIVGGKVQMVNELGDAPLPDLMPYQFFSMLDLSGNTAALNAYVASLTDPAKTIAQNKLDHSLVFERQNPLVLAAQVALGLTDAQLNALWTQAAAIT